MCWSVIRISSVIVAMLGQVDFAAAALQRGLSAAGGRIVGTYCKRELPNYQVFDERRYFASGRDAGFEPVVFEVGGTRFGVLICEDAWFDEPAQAAKAAGAQVLCGAQRLAIPSGQGAEREAAHGRAGASAGAAAALSRTSRVVQDEVVFDGASFAVSAQGSVAARRRSFERGAGGRRGRRRGAGGPVRPPGRSKPQAWQALVIGVRDYIGKNGFPGCDHRPVGRHRLGAGAGDRGRCAGRRQGAHA